MQPEKIGRYEVKSELGRGGMATVFEAYDPVFERMVAVKVLPREFLHDPAFRARFVREAKTIAALEHPAIVPVYDFGEDDGQPYLVLRLMPGGSLADRLRQGPLSIDETATILRRLGSALNHAHSQGIVHRDLKPGNILFDQYGDAFLSDFGIVHVASSTSAAPLTATGSVVGTPTYMSPEQVYGDKALDGRSDIYALGVILFQMLTGDLPYNADTPARLMMKHVMDPVPEILSRRPDLPPAASEIITKAMAKKPDERYPTAGDLSEALAALTTRKSAPPAIADRPTEIEVEPPTQLDVAPDADVTLPPAADDAVTPAATPAEAVKKRAIPAWAWGALAALVLLCIGGVAASSWLLSQGLASLTGAATATIGPSSSPAGVAVAEVDTEEPGEATAEATATEPAEPTESAAGETPTADLVATRESAEATRAAGAATPGGGFTDVAATRDSAFATRAAGGGAPGIAPAFGPQNGRLEHLEDGFIESVSSGVNLQDFVMEATVGNPYAATAGSWDFGIIFRQFEIDQEFRLVVDSSGAWSLNDRRGAEDVFVHEGNAVDYLNLGQGEVNTIRLIAWQNRGYFFLNGSIVAALDLSGRSDFGDVALGTGFYLENEQEGQATPYQDFAVWSLAPQFGPRDGQLEHIDDNLVKSRNAGVSLASLMTEATFVNPYTAATGGWDIGFAFRQTDVNDQFWLVVDSAGEWSLINRVAGEDNYLDEGTVANLNVNEGGRNHLALIAWGNQGYFFLNGNYAALLDLSGRMDSGDVQVVTAFFVGNEVPGNVTGYEGFTVLGLP